MNRKPASAVANGEAWKAYNQQYARDQKNEDAWAHFLNGWLAKAAHFRKYYGRTS